MISVIMPAYNAEAFVERGVRSILDQTHRDFEFIAVDDGSTDRTAAILHQLAAEDPRLRVLDGNHRGGSAALNLAAGEAMRPWLAVMHADDEAMPDRLERQLAAATARPEVVVWGSHGQLINGEGRVLGLSCYGPTSMTEFERDFAAGLPINVLHPGAMLRRDVFLEVGGYDPAIGNCEDLDLFMRMAHHGPVVTLAHVGMRYRLHQGSNTIQRHRRQSEEFRFVMDRRRREITGEPTLTLDGFRAAYAALPWRRRLRDARMDRGAFRFRNAGTCLGQRRVGAGAVNLALATLLRPRFVAGRLWNQRLSPAALQNLQRPDDPPSAPERPQHIGRTEASTVLDRMHHA